MRSLCAATSTEEWMEVESIVKQVIVMVVARETWQSVRPWMMIERRQSEERWKKESA
jgi:hypothetical protein